MNGSRQNPWEGSVSDELQRILRMADVERLVGFKKSQIYALIAREKFPRPIKLSERSSGWLESELARWQQERIKISRQAA